MNRTHRQFRLAKGLLVELAICVVSLGASAQHSPHNCSLAFVTHSFHDAAAVCDIKLVRQLATNGHAFEQNQMGLASMLVIGPDYSEKEALTWFERSAQRGYAPAEVNLAVMYSNGWGTAVNFGAAQHWLREAANQHFARAYFNLGILYLEGKGVRQDYSEAFRWFKQGAEAGDSSAQTNLGYMYDQGLGCPKDSGKAVALYEKAADAGNPLGEHNLADLYLRGEGVARDYKEAFQWFQKAAVQGQTGAQIKLGYMYANGQGTEKNPELAYAWIKTAQASGDNRGIEMLRSLEQVLNVKSLAEAQQEASKLYSSTLNVWLSGFLQ